MKGNGAGHGTGRNGAGRSIDWEAARARLDLFSRMVAETERASPARSQALLEARAERLAQPPPEPPRAGQRLELTVFTLARERYALEARLVREIVRFAEFTPVPGAADFLVGVTNLRGEILPVIDLRRFFALPAQGLTDQARVLVLGHDRKDLGVLADAADQMVDLHVDELRAPPAAHPGPGRDVIRGVTREALIVLDGDRLLRDPRLVIDHSEAIRRAERPA